ncbi:MAG: hypothetical protein AAGF83_26605 [Cyanobacteria bacterium P01_G01_bin.67]
MGVEGNISEGTRGFDLREYRYVSLDKIDLQYTFTMSAMNAICLFAWFEGIPLAENLFFC